LGLRDAWADDATGLTPATLKTLVKVARDIYPHDFLGDGYYITAIKPWDGKAAKDPGVKSLINDGVARLNQEANDRHKVPYAEVPWEADRVALLQRIEQTAFFQKIRGDLVVSLSLQPEGAMAQVRLRRLLRRTWRLHGTRLRRYRLAPEGLGPGNKRSRGDPNGKIRSE
jgi:hypothetical protein